MAILDKQSLAEYIVFKFSQLKEGAQISPIKLQKGLYFLYAMWGGKVLLAKGESKQDTEADDLYGAWDEYLFEASFAAWKYGPVDENIWIWYKNKQNIDDLTGRLKFVDKCSYQDEVVNYVDELLVRIFATSDFGLVDLSHEDICWQSKVGSNSPMSNKEIIEEYAKRYGYKANA